MRCDLHVHSVHSGRVSLPILGSLGNECYSEPQEVYDRCHRLGLELVTLTDHDTIDGALRIAHLPGVFISEEVTLILPGAHELHMGVLAITEEQHTRLSALRRDGEAFFAYCAEQSVPVVINHLFAAITGPRAVSDLHFVLDRAEMIESRNGMMPPPVNRFAEQAGEIHGRAVVGGSDAHTLAAVGRTYTQVPGARSQEEYLAGLRCGFGIPKGSCGSYAHLTNDVTRVFAGSFRDAAAHALHDWRAAIRLAALVAGLPVLPALPLVTAVIYARDQLFAALDFRRYMRSLGQDVAATKLGLGEPWQTGSTAHSAWSEP
jgi:predicted metal-dependent phosphoesterase TrpH